MEVDHSLQGRFVGGGMHLTTIHMVMTKPRMTLVSLGRQVKWWLESVSQRLDGFTELTMWVSTASTSGWSASVT